MEGRVAACGLRNGQLRPLSSSLSLRAKIDSGGPRHREGKMVVTRLDRTSPGFGVVLLPQSLGRSFITAWMIYVSYLISSPSWLHLGCKVVLFIRDIGRLVK